MAYSPRTDDGPVIITDGAERAHYLSRAMLVLAEKGITSATPTRLWMHLVALTLGQGRVWIKRERAANAQALGVAEPNLSRAITPLVKAGLITYEPGTAARGAYGGRISRFEINLEALGLYDADADPLADEIEECDCPCTCGQEPDLGGDFSGLPEDDDAETVVDVTPPAGSRVSTEPTVVSLDDWRAAQGALDAARRQAAREAGWD